MSFGKILALIGVALVLFAWALLALHVISALPVGAILLGFGLAFAAVLFAGSPPTA